MGHAGDGFCDVAKDDAGDQEDEEDERHDAAHQRCGADRKLAVSGPPGGAFGEHAGEQREQRQPHRRQGRDQAPALVGGQGRKLGRLSQVAVQRRRGQARLDHPVGQVPAEPDDEQGRGGREEPVVQGVQLDARINDLRPGLGDALQHRVERRRHEIGAEAPRHPGEGGSDARQWMPSRSLEDHRAERDHQHVAGVHCGVTDDGDQQQHRRDHRLGGHVHERLQAGADEPRVVGDADAEHGEQHDAKGMKADEGGDHFGQEVRQFTGRGQTLNFKGRAGARINVRIAELRQHRREDPDGDQQGQKQHRRIRQPVAEHLDPIEQSNQPGAALRFVHPLSRPNRLAAERQQ